MAAVFMSFRGSQQGEIYDLLVPGKPDSEEFALFNATSIIFGIELSAVVSAICQDRYRLKGKAITVYIDNNAALEALINGDSRSTAAFSLIDTLWYIVAAFLFLNLV